MQDHAQASSASNRKFLRSREHGSGDIDRRWGGNCLKAILPLRGPVPGCLGLTRRLGEGIGVRDGCSTVPKPVLEMQEADVPLLGHQGASVTMH